MLRYKWMDVMSWASLVGLLLCFCMTMVLEIAANDQLARMTRIGTVIFLLSAGLILIVHIVASRRARTRKKEV